MSSTTGHENGDGQHPRDVDSTATDTTPTLVCPHDAAQALAWVPAAQLTLTRAYEQVPAPDPGKLRELAVSIAREGVLQPLLVTPSADGAQYEVVKGRRRWLAARMSGTLLPALVRQFSPSQKNQAFLAAHVCTEVSASQEQLTTAYDATWTSVAADAASDVPAAVDGDIDEGAADEGARVAAVIAQMQQLSPFASRHLARELVVSDATLWESVLAEASHRLQVQTTSDRARLEQELAEAQATVRKAEDQQHRQTQTLAAFGQQVTEARMSYQRSEDQRHDIERLRQELLTENRRLRGQLQHLQQRLVAVRPGDHIVEHPHVAALAQTVMEIVAAAGAPLVTQALRLLHPLTTREATAALGRALDLVEERIRVCRQQLIEDARITTIQTTVGQLDTEGE
jgi:hypothetical protein